MAKREQETKKEVTFTKNQLLLSKRFKPSRDALYAILKENEQYTISEVEKILADFMKGKVK